MGKPWENTTKLDPICHVFLQFAIMPFRGVPFLQPRESWYMPRPLIKPTNPVPWVKVIVRACEHLVVSWFSIPVVISKQGCVRPTCVAMSDFHGTWSLFDHKGITWESLGEAWLPRASTRVAYTKPFASILQLPNVNIWGYQKTRHPKGGNLFYYRVHHNVVPIIFVTWFYCPSFV